MDSSALFNEALANNVEVKPEEEEETTPPVAEESTNYTLNGAANKTSKSEEFDDIFGDDESDGSEDDLPF